jgi:sigma-B regulation protein RsbU (phosphoserine phosphatase)
VLEALNQSLYGDLSTTGGFITAVYLLLDKQTGNVRMASAGHPPVVWMHNENSESTLLERTGPALGLEAEPVYTETQITVSRGDCLLLFTDGVFDGDEDALTAPDLATVLTESDADRTQLLQSIYQRVTAQALADRDDITMIPLEHDAGASHFDDAGGSRQPPVAAPAKTTAVLLEGVGEAEAFLSISGTASWMRSTSFLEAAERLVKRYPQLTIDLGGCEYLDSTFLGTLHEIVARKPDAIRLQHLPDAIRALFEELSMEAVLHHVVDDDHALPDVMRPLRRIEEDSTRQAQRLLKAHEVLASLSDENREQFQGVVESLRAEVG